MLRADLVDARREWMKTAQNNSGEYEKRLQSDFLSDENHEGERLHFHSLRNTCAGWLAMSGAHPKAVQAGMRHSTTTLTMDTYGHFFQDQEADTVARFAEYMGDKPDQLRSTGTTDPGATPGDGADPQRDGARGYDETSDTQRANNRRKSLQAANQCAEVRSDATENHDAPGRTRTCGLRFRKPLDDSTTTKTPTDCGDGAENTSNNPGNWTEIATPAEQDLLAVVNAWPNLPQHVKAAILTMVELSRVQIDAPR